MVLYSAEEDVKVRSDGGRVQFLFDRELHGAIRVVDGTVGDVPGAIQDRIRAEIPCVRGAQGDIRRTCFVQGLAGGGCLGMHRRGDSGQQGREVREARHGERGTVRQTNEFQMRDGSQRAEQKSVKGAESEHPVPGAEADTAVNERTATN